MSSNKRRTEDMVANDRNDAVQPLPAETQGMISKQLRQVYGKMLSEPIPDKFSSLLQQLAKSEAKK